MLNCTGCGTPLLKDGSTYCVMCREKNRAGDSDWGLSRKSAGTGATGKHHAANQGRLRRDGDSTADEALVRADLLAELKRIAADPELTPAMKTELAWNAIERGSIE